MAGYLHGELPDCGTAATGANLAVRQPRAGAAYANGCPTIARLHLAGRSEIGRTLARVRRRGDPTASRNFWPGARLFGHLPAMRAGFRRGHCADANAGEAMLKDLSALTPPVLMAAAFLFAAGAFVRHEMRAGKNRADDAAETDSESDSATDADDNASDQPSVPRSFDEKPDDGSED
jgi:hypothetical protein